jgi:hypothetical protein
VEGRQPASIRTILAIPRWKARLLRFIELSGVGRVVDGEDETQAARLDRWVGGGGEGRGVAVLFISFLLFPLFVQGNHTPIFAYSASLKWRISLCSQALRGS